MTEDQQPGIGLDEATLRHSAVSDVSGEIQPGHPGDFKMVDLDDHIGDVD